MIMTLFAFLKPGDRYTRQPYGDETVFVKVNANYSLKDGEAPDINYCGQILNARHMQADWPVHPLPREA